MCVDDFSEAHRVREQIEQSIKNWVYNTYNRQIGVSVQVLYYRQASDRVLPSNTLCRHAYKDGNRKMMCDRSDLAMKLICKERGNHASIGYRCHLGLSNVVVPYFDTDITSQCWYIFLGQFIVQPGPSCKGCPRKGQMCAAHNRLLENANIVQAGGDDMNSVSSDNRGTVQEHLFSTVPKHWPGDWTLDIVQVLTCKTMAIHLFKDTFSNKRSDLAARDNLKMFAEEFSKPPPTTGQDDEPEHPLHRPS